MDKKIYIVDKSGDGNSSIYTAKLHSEPDNTSVKLFHSGIDSGWSEKCRGKLAGSLLDHGNGVTVKFKDKKINLDFSELEELRMMLNQLSKLTVINNKYNTHEFLELTPEGKPNET